MDLPPLPGQIGRNQGIRPGRRIAVPFPAPVQGRKGDRRKISFDYYLHPGAIVHQRIIYGREIIFYGRKVFFYGRKKTIYGTKRNRIIYLGPISPISYIILIEVYVIVIDLYVILIEVYVFLTRLYLNIDSLYVNIDNLYLFLTGSHVIMSLPWKRMGKRSGI